MSDWVKKTVGEFITLQRGYDLTDAERRLGNIPVMGAAGQNGFHDVARASAPGVVLGRSGGSYGEVHLAKKDFWPHNTSMFVTDFKGNDPYFAYYFLKNLDLKSLNSGSAQPSLNRNYVYPVKIRVPSTALQCKIAAILSALDAKIDLNNRVNAELEALAKTIYDYWFVQFDFPDAHGRPYKTSGGAMIRNDTLKREIPAGWSDAPISSVVEVLGGGTPSKTIEGYWNGAIPFFTPTDAVGDVFVLQTQDAITLDGLNNCSSELFSKGTVFITARGSVGRLSIAAVPMAMNQSCYALRPKNELDHPFVFFHAKTLINYLKVKASGSTFNSIVTNDIEWTRLINPPSQTIAAFCESAAPIFIRIETAQRENLELTQLRDWLLPLLMNGQVRVS